MTSHESLVTQSNDLKPVKKNEEKKEVAWYGQAVVFSSLRVFCFVAPAVVL